MIDVKFPRHSFGEWGYFMILANTYHEHYYTAGFKREDLYSDKRLLLYLISDQAS